MTNMLFPTQDANRMTMINEMLAVGLRFKVHDQDLLNTRQRVRLLRRGRTFARTLTRVTLLDQEARVLKPLRDTQVDHLIRVIRHFWSGVRQRARRLDHGVSVFDCYGMHRSRSPRGYMAVHLWLDQARRLLSGEDKAVAMGFPPMSCPSRSELQEAFDEVHASSERWDRLTLRRLLLREKLARQRKRLDRGLRETVAFFNYMMRPLSRVIRQTVLRSIGIRFYCRRQSKWEACPFARVDPLELPPMMKPPKPVTLRHAASSRKGLKALPAALTSERPAEVRTRHGGLVACA